MTWTKLGDEFGPESGGLTDGEFRTHVEALVYSNWRLLDLYVPKAEVRRFAGSVNVTADVDGLVLKGWWADAGPNWYIGLRFPEWQRDRVQVETRRAYLAEAQRRKRAHDSGDHSRCLPSSRCRQSSTVDTTVDPGRDGTVTGNAVRPKVNSRTSSGAFVVAELEEREREARAERSPKAPSPQTSDGSNSGGPVAQHIPGEGSAGASVSDRYAREDSRKRVGLDRDIMSALADVHHVSSVELERMVHATRKNFQTTLKQLVHAGKVTRTQDGHKAWFSLTGAAMSTIPVVADKVRKARFESDCPACHDVIRIGQLIAHCGGMWMHASCLIGHRHQLDHNPSTEGKRP